MEARDSGSKIRPLPIDELDGDAPQPDPVEPKRRILPLVVIIAGALAFGVIARGLSVGDTVDVGSATTVPPTLAEEAEPTSTTEPPPAPPASLRDMLPFVTEDGLQLVTANSSSARVGHWDADSAFPIFNANIGQPLTAAYNTTGSHIAIHTATRGGSLVVDDADGGGPIYLTKNITAALWHPTDADLFAWSVSEGPSTMIRVADVASATSAGIDPLIEFALEGEHRLEAWGDWGFATASGDTVFGWDSDGLADREASGTFFDAADDGTLLLGELAESETLPFLLDPDGVRTDLASLDIGASDFRITGEGDWVLAVTIQADGHTSILARTVQSRSTRLSSIDETARVVGSAWADRVLVLQEELSGDLVFKDWNTGAEYRIPDHDTVLAVFLPDTRF